MPLDKPQNIPNSSLSTPYTIVNSDVAELGNTIATFYSGTTAQRPTINLNIGDQFYNTQLKQLELYTENGWVAEGTAPQAPTNVTVSGAAIAYGGTPAALIKWVNATSGAPASTYTATSTPGSLTATGTSGQLTITGLTAGTSYTFTVTATNTYGSATSAASGALVAGTISQPPTSVVATAVGGTASIAFTPPSNTGAATVTSYTVLASPGGITTQGTSSPIIVNGLTANTPYTFIVFANNSAGSSLPSNSSNQITPTNASTVTGGTLNSDATYYYRSFTTVGSNTLTIGNAPLTADLLIIAGGGAGGGAHGGGGGGAGGVLYLSGQSLPVGNQSLFVGAGGLRVVNGLGAPGANSTFNAFTAIGGGNGDAEAASSNAGGGGSGGGGGGTPNQVSPFNNPFVYHQGGPGTSGQGFAGGNGGGNGTAAANQYASGGGGGGAGAAGQNSVVLAGNGLDANNSRGGDGGAGTSAYSSWGAATGLGQNVGGTYWFAGGGGGGGWNASVYGAGGNGGGGNGAYNNGSRTAASYLGESGDSGLSNTGGGGGGSPASPPSGGGNRNGGNGGSGVIIVRYTKASVGG